MPLGSILRSAIGRGLSNDQNDVLKLKEMFADKGRLAKPKGGFNPFFDRSLEEAITRFQAENNLLTDGFLRPGGETERNLSRAFDPTVSTLAFDLDIGGGVGNGAANDPKDLQNVSQALGVLDHLKFDRTANPPSFMTPGLEDGIRAFQRDKNLLEDGQITHDGETINALRGGIGIRKLPGRNDIPARIVQAVVRHELGKGPNPVEPTELNAEGNEAPAEAIVDQPEAPQMPSTSMGASERNPENEERVDTPDNSEFIVDNPNKKEIKWKELPLPKVRGKLEWKVKDGIRVKLGSVATGFDALHYSVDWFPLDKSGRPMTVVKKPGVEPGLAITAFGSNINSSGEIFRPPFKRKDGWQVRVWVPPQHASNGNSVGGHLDITYPDGTLIE